MRDRSTYQAVAFLGQFDVMGLPGRLTVQVLGAAIGLSTRDSSILHLEVIEDTLSLGGPGYDIDAGIRKLQSRTGAEP